MEYENIVTTPKHYGKWYKLAVVGLILYLLLQLIFYLYILYLLLQLIFYLYIVYITIEIKDFVNGATLFLSDTEATFKYIDIILKNLANCTATWC